MYYHQFRHFYPFQSFMYFQNFQYLIFFLSFQLPSKVIYFHKPQNEVLFYHYDFLVQTPSNCLSLLKQTNNSLKIVRFKALLSIPLEENNSLLLILQALYLLDLLYGKLFNLILKQIFLFHIQGFLIIFQQNNAFQ